MEFMQDINKDKMKQATNGIGWCVEFYTKQLGWKPLSKSFDTWDEAKNAMSDIDGRTDRKNLRVYEVLKDASD